MDPNHHPLLIVCSCIGHGDFHFAWASSLLPQCPDRHPVVEPPWSPLRFKMSVRGFVGEAIPNLSPAQKGKPAMLCFVVARGPMGSSNTSFSPGRRRGVAEGGSSSVPRLRRPAFVGLPLAVCFLCAECSDMSYLAGSPASSASPALPASLPHLHACLTWLTCLTYPTSPAPPAAPVHRPDEGTVLNG